MFLTYNEKEKLFILNEISLPQNVLIEYKYVFYHNNQKIWEILPNNSNRKIELKDSSSIIHDNEYDPIPLITKPISPPQKPSKPRTKVKKRSSRKASDNKPIPPKVSISIPIYQPQKKNNEIDNLDVLDYNSDNEKEKENESEKNEIEERKQRKQRKKRKGKKEKEEDEEEEQKEEEEDKEEEDKEEEKEESSKEEYS